MTFWRRPYRPILETTYRLFYSVVKLNPKGSKQKMYKYSLYDSTRLIKPNP